MNISAASDYGIRAALYLAGSYSRDVAALSTTEEIAQSQEIPLKFLETLIRRLKEAGLVESRRGIKGGHHLSKAPTEISLADVIRAIDGPLAAVRGERPESLKYEGSAKNLTTAWIAVRSSLRSVLENITLEDVVKGTFSTQILKSTKSSEAWRRR